MAMHLNATICLYFCKAKNEIYGFSVLIYRIKVRGHNVFWGVARHTQNWVQALSQHDLLQEMSARINGVIGQTKGM